MLAKFQIICRQLFNLLESYKETSKKKKKKGRENKKEYKQIADTILPYS